jgi:cytochrome d ubiquinol oxidase subunit I
MDELGQVRLLFGSTLGVHILFATLGVGMPGAIAVAEALALRRRDALYRLLARRWAAVFGVFLATGVVSGTLVAVQLQLLWPAFMRLVGQVIALPFAIEVFAFFLEAVFIAVYLYAGDRVGPRWRLASAVLVAVGAAASALLITDVNAFMNTPTGFRVAGGRLVDVRPWRAMLSPAMPVEVSHVLATAYLAVALVLAAFAAAGLRRARGAAEQAYHRRALAVAMGVEGVAAVATALTGDWSGKFLAAQQPRKFAAAEAVFRTGRGLAEVVGGWADLRTGTVRGGIRIPGLLSWLATGRWDGRVVGLDAFPRAEWPPVAPAHLLFDAMVAVGVLALLQAAFYGAWAVWGRGRPVPPGWLRFAVAMGPVGLVGIECGWVFAELARQPWTVVGVLTTAQAVTTNPAAGGLLVPFWTLYAALLAGAVAALVVHRRRHPLADDLRAAGGGEPTPDGTAAASPP